MTNVSNKDLLTEIYRSQLSYTDLSRAEQRALPLPNLHVSHRSEIPAGHDGIAKVWDGSYLNLDASDVWKPPFAPFQLVRNGETIASAFLDRSGNRSIHGRLTDGLGLLLLKMATNYARRPNWSGYSYLDDMVGTAVVDSMGPVLRFDNRRSNNPFAYLTTNIYYSFVKYVAREKALSTHRTEMVDAAMTENTWSLWIADDAERDNSDTAIYDEICAEMDLLFADELKRRNAVKTVRKQKYKLRMTPILAAAVRYGLSLPLSAQSIAAHFGLEPATVTRIRNNIDRSKSQV